MLSVACYSQGISEIKVSLSPYKERRGTRPLANQRMDRLHQRVKQMVERESAKTWTPEACLILTQLVSYQLDRLSVDLESFTRYKYAFHFRHARRTMVSPEEVKLCLRHNQALLSEMHNFIDGLLANRKPAAAKKRKPERDNVFFPAAADDWPEGLESLLSDI